MSKKAPLDNRPFKSKLAGFPTSRPAKPSRTWFNGKLLSESEMSNIPQEEIHASNNVIRKAKNGKV